MLRMRRWIYTMLRRCEGDRNIARLIYAKHVRFDKPISVLGIFATSLVCYRCPSSLISFSLPFRLFFRCAFVPQYLCPCVYLCSISLLASSKPLFSSPFIFVSFPCFLLSSLNLDFKFSSSLLVSFLLHCLPIFVILLFDVTNKLFYRVQIFFLQTFFLFFCSLCLILAICLIL